MRFFPFSLNLFSPSYYLSTFRAMEPPTEQIFDSRELLVASVRQHALSHGYATTIIRSTVNRQVYLGCDRGGTYHNRVNA